MDMVLSKNSRILTFSCLQMVIGGAPISVRPPKALVAASLPVTPARPPPPPPPHPADGRGTEARAQQRRSMSQLAQQQRGVGGSSTSRLERPPQQRAPQTRGGAGRQVGPAPAGGMMSSEAMRPSATGSGMSPALMQHIDALKRNKPSMHSAKVEEQQLAGWGMGEFRVSASLHLYPSLSYLLTPREGKAVKNYFGKHCSLHRP
jgi:hypothetical protein